MSVLEHDRFVVKQLIRPTVNLYEVHTRTPGTDALGDLVAFVRQKRIALREDLRAFTDDSEQEELFRIKARSVVDIGGRYNVTAPDGAALGALVKLFRQSLLRSTWRVVDASDGELFLASERSLGVAIGRRVADLVPYGDLLPIPYHFVFRSGEREIGGLTRKIALRDQYELDLSGDPERTIDRRLAIALAIALDALQGR